MVPLFPIGNIVPECVTIIYEGHENEEPDVMNGVAGN